MPLQSNEVLSLPWEFVGMDLFMHKNKEYLLMVDFYSFFFGDEEIASTTASKVVEVCMKHFAMHRLPSKLMTDNGSPFSSREF